ncbi:bZIP transcription factor [Halocatena marina]|uniref:bZIP transcription factor n=1 Tax=Halocatena marina TaxID=2934937 RepID=UPI00200E7F04|nr:bZIP transcription factor [Halocatena marina]
MSTDHSHPDAAGNRTIPVELRGVDALEEVSLGDIWVAGQPIGILVEKSLERSKELEQRYEELEAENQRLRERIATLEGRVVPDPTTKDYEEKTRDEKVREVRLSCARKATNNSGKASIDYNDVMTLFDHHPSVGHTYTLLKRAATLDGFDYEKRDDGNDRLCVNLDDVKDESVFHAVNKPNGGDPR